jgi:hypothetical protein
MPELKLETYHPIPMIVCCLRWISPQTTHDDGFAANRSAERPGPAGEPQTGGASVTGAASVAGRAGAAAGRAGVAGIVGRCGMVGEAGRARPLRIGQRPRRGKRQPRREHQNRRGGFRGSRSRRGGFRGSRSRRGGFRGSRSRRGGFGGFPEPDGWALARKEAAERGFWVLPYWTWERGVGGAPPRVRPPESGLLGEGRCAESTASPAPPRRQEAPEPENACDQP